MWYLESPFIYYPLYSYMLSIETLAARDIVLNGSIWHYYHSDFQINISNLKANVTYYSKYVLSINEYYTCINHSMTEKHQTVCC